MIVVNGLIKLFILWPCYFLLKLFPRNNQIWCFSSYRDSFVDNSKYLFHYVHKYHKDITPIWVTNDNELLSELRGKGYQAVKKKSIKGIVTVCRAKYVVYSSYVAEIGFWQTAGAKKVNLWHGLPLKKIEFDVDSGVLADKYDKNFNLKQLLLKVFYPAAYVRPDYVTAPSAKMAEIFKSAFRVNDEAIICAASPRTDQFFSPEKFAPLIDSSSSTNKRKTFIYMPTFRDTGKTFFSNEYFDFDALDKAMLEIDGEFLIKAHPAAGAESLDLSQYSRVKLLPSNVDMYPVLKESHALVTDYSSIYIDYLMLDKPIHFYCFDLSEYLSTCRSMYFEYHDVTPGSKSESFNELLSAITSTEDSYLKERHEIKELFWGQNSKESCEDIIQHIKKHE